MNKLICFMVAITLPFLLGAGTLRDPTQPPNYEGEGVTRNGFDLTAIFIYPTYRFAIINDQAMMVGGQIGEYIITTITPNTVELTGRNNAKEVLQLVTSIKQMK